MSGANKSVGKNFTSTIEHPLVKLPRDGVNFGRRNLRNNMLVNIVMSKSTSVGMFHDGCGGSDGESRAYPDLDLGDLSQGIIPPTPIPCSARGILTENETASSRANTKNVTSYVVEEREIA
ncbi:hypothetical protein ACH5RR_034225 [Cinchona calisaya]|uniref:Uncharacterized protein n=1 Tax=Cinchona calisaya TaxID=153742 RepID=A0ABD2YE49_9GENT